MGFPGLSHSPTKSHEVSCTYKVSRKQYLTSLKCITDIMIGMQHYFYISGIMHHSVRHCNGHHICLQPRLASCVSVAPSFFLVSEKATFFLMGHSKDFWELNANGFRGLRHWKWLMELTSFTSNSPQQDHR